VSELEPARKLLLFAWASCLAGIGVEIEGGVGSGGVPGLDPLER
jgi:hypothetical protein